MTDNTRDDENIRQLTKEFLADTLDHLKSMEPLLREQRPETVLLLGHTLKGTGAIFGFPEISELGTRLEETVGAGDWDGAAEITKKLIDLIHNLLS